MLALSKRTDGVWLNFMTGPGSERGWYLRSPVPHRHYTHWCRISEMTASLLISLTETLAPWLRSIPSGNNPTVSARQGKPQQKGPFIHNVFEMLHSGIYWVLNWGKGGKTNQNMKADFPAKTEINQESVCAVLLEITTMPLRKYVSRKRKKNKCLQIT